MSDKKRYCIRINLFNALQKNARNERDVTMDTKHMLHARAIVYAILSENINTVELKIINKPVDCVEYANVMTNEVP